MIKSFLAYADLGFSLVPPANSCFSFPRTTKWKNLNKKRENLHRAVVLNQTKK